MLLATSFPAPLADASPLRDKSPAERLPCLFDLSSARFSFEVKNSRSDRPEMKRRAP